jgi:16S rRNA (cytidine1402-2'-O)-methyltransferase
MEHNDERGNEGGTLFVCATPIGNLKDITLRGLDVLRSVDFVVAEDTRVAKRLLNHYGIKKPVISFHEHSKKGRLRHLLNLLESGHKLAIISDAGTPCISDPGSELVSEALSRGFRVVPIPGPSAITAALSVAGMKAQRFIFLGFLPRERNERKKLLSEVSLWRYPIVIYEAPHRLVETLTQLLQALGNRKVVVARELTKQFEEVFASDLESARKHFLSTEPRGEFTLVIEGASKPSQCEVCKVDEKDIDELIQKMLSEGSSTKEVVNRLVLEFGMRHKEAYERTLIARNKFASNKMT